MARFLFGPINKLNGGGKMGRVANRNLITAEQIDLRKQLECINAPANNVVEPGVTPSSPIGAGSTNGGGGSTNSVPSGDGTYQLSTDPSAGIPILYGQCQVRGAVFDSEMTSNGTILTTALMLAERTGAGINGNATYTLNEVYFNDAKLNLYANGSVANAILNDGTVSTKYNTNTKVFLYSGSVDNKIYSYKMGGANVVPTYQIARTYMQNWANVQVQARGTVFALIQQTYDAANGVQGLGTWTFDITNTSLSNPGDVLYEYLTNERYGSQYDANSINSNTIIGSESTSLKSIANETRLFTSSIATDATANLSNITNSTIYPQLVTSGGVGNATYSNVLIASSSVNGDITGNVRFPGNNNIRGSANSEIYSRGVNRLNVFWANAASSGANCENIISGNASTSPNTFTGFIDIARLVPDGSNIEGYTFTDANINTGKMFPGDTYVLSNTDWQGGTADTITIDSALTPTATITNLFVEGDKIRPEGSPFVYTVASNVSVTGAGYKQFSIPVKERIVVPDFANIDMGNATLQTEYNIHPSSSVASAKRFQFDNDDIGIFWNNGWPFSGVDINTAIRFPGVANMSLHANLLYSNLLVGNAIMSSQNTANDSIVLGEEENMTINGLIKTDKTVQDIQKEILKHSGSMLTWELPEGRWKAIPNANANITGAKTYNDDNIVGEIKVTTSDITTYYNSARAQYVEKNHNSVKEDIIVHTPNFELNTNESKHKMELNYPLCDSASEAQRKADVELKQNRLDKVINFKSDYTGLGVEPGDIIKVTNTDYGFTDKTFRAVRVRETMDDDILLLDITAIEWSNETYTDRIPFRKPALDDIEFEPEEYSDFIINEEMLEEDIKLSGVLLSKFIGNDQSGSSTGGSTLLDLGGGLHEFTSDKLGATIRKSSESFLLTAFMMPQGTYTLQADGVTPTSLFTVKGRLIAYVSNATSNVAFTGNIAIGSLAAPPPQQLSLRIDVPKDVSNVKVRVQGAIDGPFDGGNDAGFDEIGVLGLRENT